MSNQVPYKTFLSEGEIPQAWYNVRADMKTDHRPIINPATGKPATLSDLEPVFCTELAKQELNNTDRFIPIPDEILSFYKCIALHLWSELIS